MIFDQLSDEILELIIDHTQPGFNQRSRKLTQGICRELLDSHEHTSLVTERLLTEICWLPTEHLKYYTFIQELTKWFHSKNIHEIRLKVYANNPMAVKAYEKYGFEHFVHEMKLK